RRHVRAAGIGPRPQFARLSLVGERLLQRPDAGLGIVLRLHAQMVAHGRLRCRDCGNSAAMIGNLRSVVLDTKDPRQLGQFYEAVLGGTFEAVDDTWSVLTDPTGRRLAFQLSPE